MSEFADKVNELVGKMEQTEGGKWKLPEDVAEGLDEPTLVAVNTERRFRDTQANFTRSQQALKTQQAINEDLTSHVLDNAALELTEEQQTELDDLKKSDPEAWRVKVSEYEATSKQTLSSKLQEISTESSKKSEKELRVEKLTAFKEASGLDLTDDIIENDLPPRYLKNLESGEITFDEFLEKAATFLGKEKIIAGADDTDENNPNLSDVAGGREPAQQAQEGDFNESYSEVIF